MNLPRSLVAPAAIGVIPGEGSSRRWLAGAVFAASAVAWFLLAGEHGLSVTAGHDHAGTHSHAGHLPGPGLWPAALPWGAWVVWVAGWTVMVVAMMVPPALPLFRVVDRLVGGRRHGWALLGAAAGGFLAAWVAAGAVLLAVATVLHAGAHLLALLVEHPQLPSGLAAVAAGGYQLTPLKRACLTACRTPTATAMTTWTGTRPAGYEAGLIGLRYGAVCVGCCWALMVLSLAVGVAALPVMVVAGVVMAVERLRPDIRPLVPVIAVASVVAGVAILAGLVPPGLPAAFPLP